MKLTCQHKENKIFETKLREKYSEEISNIVIDWLEDGLSYVMKETSNEDIFILGYMDRNDESIEYNEEEYSIEDAIGRIIPEIEMVLDDQGTESREIVQKEYDLLNKAIY